MPNRLKALNQFDFTGGINLRPETFQLLENELPELFNMEVDPRGGLNVRKGWEARQHHTGHRGHVEPAQRVRPHQGQRRPARARRQQGDGGHGPAVQAV